MRRRWPDSPKTPTMHWRYCWPSFPRTERPTSPACPPEPMPRRSRVAWRPPCSWRRRRRRRILRRRPRAKLSRPLRKRWPELSTPGLCPLLQPRRKPPASPLRPHLLSPRVRSGRRALSFGPFSECVRCALPQHALCCLCMHRFFGRRRSERQKYWVVEARLSSSCDSCDHVFHYNSTTNRS